jgi:Protein of unknown function (DUF3631)
MKTNKTKENQAAAKKKVGKVKVPSSGQAKALSSASATNPIDGSAVLDGLLAYIKRYVAVTESQARVIAVWAVHTHLFNLADTTAYLSITSAEKQSGKTVLLDVLETIVCKPWQTGSVTAAVLARRVDAEKPTLLLDEFDAKAAGENSETLRGVLNTGYRRGGKTSRCIGEGADISYKDFSTFCPKAIAGIGQLPETVADRSISIRLKRALAGEVPAKFRVRNTRDEAANLRQQIEAWCTDKAISNLATACPQLPDGLSGRQQDCVEPLVAIADAAGGDWPQRMRQAIVALCIEAQYADESIGKQLLADIRQVFDELSEERLSSSQLATALAQIETSPWGEYCNGKGLTASRLARLLKPYGISPGGMRIADKTPRGYTLDQFDDAFKRYVSPPDSGPPLGIDPETATPQQGPADESGPSDGVGVTNAEPQNGHTVNGENSCVVAVLNALGDEQ